MEALIERGPLSLDQALRKAHCEGSILAMLRTVFQVVSVLVKKYGYFRITSKMIRGTRSGNLIVWFHQSTASFHKELALPSKNPHQDTATMVLDIVTIFEEATNMKSFATLRQKISSEQSLTF